MRVCKNYGVAVTAARCAGNWFQVKAGNWRSHAIFNQDSLDGWLKELNNQFTEALPKDQDTQTPPC